jgi:hypothetical protein
VGCHESGPEIDLEVHFEPPIPHAYVADGNVAAALRQKATLTALLDKELSVVPSQTFMSEFERLVGA